MEHVASEHLLIEHVVLEHLLGYMWLRASCGNMWLRASFVEHVALEHLLWNMCYIIAKNNGNIKTWAFGKHLNHYK